SYNYSPLAPTSFHLPAPYRPHLSPRIPLLTLPPHSPNTLLRKSPTSYPATSLIHCTTASSPTVKYLYRIAGFHRGAPCGERFSRASRGMRMRVGFAGRICAVGGRAERSLLRRDQWAFVQGVFGWILG